MSRIDTNIVIDYINLQNKLLIIIKSFGITQKYIYSNIKMSRETWTRKLKNKTFTPEEMMEIAKVINK